MQLKSHSQDKKITIANSLLMLSEKISHEMMVNFNIWNDWIQKILSRLLLGLELIFMVFMFGTDLIWLASDSHLPMEELFSHFIGSQLHPLPVQWRLTPFTPPVLDLQYIFRITNHNNYIWIIYINLYDSCVYSSRQSPAKSPLHNLLDQHDNNPAQGFSPLKENYSWPLWHARGQVKHLQTILIGTDELTATLIRLYRSWGPVFSSKAG